MAWDLINSFAETATAYRYDSSIQTVELAFDGDFVAGNTIDLDVNGSPIASVDFDTSHDQTMLNLAAEILTKIAVETAEVTEARVITLTASDEGNELVVTGIMVTGGLTQCAGVIQGESGGYVDGLYQAGTENSFSIRISMQPLTGKELLQFPEAQRTRRMMKGYTATYLHTAETSPSQKADRIEYNGTFFEVQTVNRWLVTDLNHYKVIVAELNPNEVQSEPTGPAEAE
jgi:hypothetical protein